MGATCAMNHTLVKSSGADRPSRLLLLHAQTPAPTATPTFSDPPLHHRGRRATQRERESGKWGMKEGEREGRRGRTATQKWESTKMTVEMQRFLQENSIKNTTYLAWFGPILTTTVWRVSCHPTFLLSWDMRSSLTPIWPSGLTGSSPAQQRIKIV